MVRGFAVLVAVVFVAGAVGGWSKRAIAADQWTGSAGSSGVWSQWRYLREALDSASGELELARIRLERAEAVVTYSGRYQIPADLAGTIYDEAVAAVRSVSPRFDSAPHVGTSRRFPSKSSTSPRRT
jgi:hypothetical protein